ncbi:MAG: hypothetical protein H0V17_12210 [Deltaproteobacteria bacterium]|nr:hypothetical protein [Deltaproteobacteria bacterium]
MMRPILIVFLLAACGAEPTSRIPKKPNTELVVGEYERRPPAGTSAFRFGSDGTYTVAKNKGEMERTPHVSEGTYKVDGDTLTFETQRGECAEQKTGSYKVNISKIGIRFIEKIEDACDWRARLAGQTLWRLK